MLFGCFPALFLIFWFFNICWILSIPHHTVTYITTKKEWLDVGKISLHSDASYWTVLVSWILTFFLLIFLHVLPLNLLFTAEHLWQLYKLVACIRKWRTFIKSTQACSWGDTIKCISQVDWSGRWVEGMTFKILWHENWKMLFRYYWK